MSAFGPLRVPAFRRLAGAYAISRFGDFLALVTLAVLVYDRMHSTLATAALFLALEFAPALFGPALTARVDRLPIRRVLPALYALEAVLFCVLAALTHAFSLAPFLALVALDGALGVAARGLCRAAIAAALERTGELRAGNALLNLAAAPSMAIGGAAGAVLIVSGGADLALLVNAATFAVGGLLVWEIRDLVHLPDGDGEGASHWRERLAEALAYIRGSRLVMVLLLAQAAVLVFFAMTEPIEVPYTRDTLGAGAGGYGALIAAWGVGVILGSVVYTWLGRERLQTAALLATLVQGAAFLGLGAATTITAACAIAVVGGAANGAQLAAISTAIQEAIAPAFQARVMTVYEAVTTAAPGLGYLVGGAVGTLAGGRVAFVVAGCGVFAVAAMAVVARPWRAHELEPSAQPETITA